MTHSLVLFYFFSLCTWFDCFAWMPKRFFFKSSRLSWCWLFWVNYFTYAVYPLNNVISKTFILNFQESFFELWFLIFFSLALIFFFGNFYFRVGSLPLFFVFIIFFQFLICIFFWFLKLPFSSFISFTVYLYVCFCISSSVFISQMNFSLYF